MHPSWPDSLETIGNGDPEFGRELITLLLDELKQTMPLLDEALATERYDNIAELAHRLAGGAAYCRFRAIAASLLRVEEAANLGDQIRLAIERETLDQLLIQITTSWQAWATNER